MTGCGNGEGVEQSIHGYDFWMDRHHPYCLRERIKTNEFKEITLVKNKEHK